MDMTAQEQLLGLLFVMQLLLPVLLGCCRRCCVQIHIGCRPLPYFSTNNEAEYSGMIAGLRVGAVQVGCTGTAAAHMCVCRAVLAA